jgi:hypothetical protein
LDMAGEAGMVIFLRHTPCLYIHFEALSRAQQGLPSLMADDPWRCGLKP